MKAHGVVIMFCSNGFKSMLELALKSLLRLRISWVNPKTLDHGLCLVGCGHLFMSTDVLSIISIQ